MGTENVIKLQTARKAVKAKALEITVERLTRIKARMSDLGFGQTDLANGIGASVSLINQMMSRKIRRTQHFGAIARVLQVNLPWLLAETNERIDMRDLDGNPISEEILPEMMASEEFRKARVSLVVIEDDDVQKELSRHDMACLREIDLGASQGIMYNEIPAKVRPHFFSRAMLAAYTPTDPKAIMVVQRIGDTMQPTLLDSDLLLVDTTRTTLDRADKIWTILYCGAGMIARLRPTSKGVRIICDNPTIADEVVEPGELRILGEVIGMLRRF